MKYSNFILFIVVLFSCSKQVPPNLSEPFPKNGWTNFKKSILYPDNYKRALANGYADVKIDIDSIGNVTNIVVLTNLPLFEDSIKAAIHRSKWIPANNNGKSINESVNLSIHFVMKRNLGERFMIIDGE
jgi:outer membrane biosynthesis protein TonB